MRVGPLTHIVEPTSIECLFNDLCHRDAVFRAVDKR